MHRIENLIAQKIFRNEFDEEVRQATVITWTIGPGKCIDQQPAYLQLSCLISFLLYFLMLIPPGLILIFPLLWFFT